MPRVLLLQVCRPWFLWWPLPERRTSRGSTCCYAKRSWPFISRCSSMAWALTAAMNSSAWQHIPSTTVCGQPSLGEGPKSLLSQRDPRPHQVELLFCGYLLTPLFPSSLSLLSFVFFLGLHNPSLSLYSFLAVVLFCSTCWLSTSWLISDLRQRFHPSGLSIHSHIDLNLLLSCWCSKDAAAAAAM